jgi:hypothetical protein
VNVVSSNIGGPFNASSDESQAMGTNAVDPRSPGAQVAAIAWLYASGRHGAELLSGAELPVGRFVSTERCRGGSRRIPLGLMHNVRRECWELRDLNGNVVVRIAAPNADVPDRAVFSVGDAAHTIAVGRPDAGHGLSYPISSDEAPIGWITNDMIHVSDLAGDEILRVTRVYNSWPWSRAGDRYAFDRELSITDPLTALGAFAAECQRRRVGGAA